MRLFKLVSYLIIMAFTSFYSCVALSESIEERFVGYVRKTVETLRYSTYKFGGSHVDTARGVYVVDCSSYVDHVLQTVYPQAYSRLVNATGSDAPTTKHYYNFFNTLSKSNSAKSNNTQRYWNKINEVKELRAGDILVFRNKKGGHIMVVMDTPVRDSNTFFVRVADSAPSGHTADTRQPHVSGIGVGTLLLKVDPKTCQPSAYAWKEGAEWKKNVSFAMARPADVV